MTRPPEVQILPVTMLFVWWLVDIAFFSIAMIFTEHDLAVLVLMISWMAGELWAWNAARGCIRRWFKHAFTPARVEEE